MSLCISTRWSVPLSVCTTINTLLTLLPTSLFTDNEWIQNLLCCESQTTEIACFSSNRSGFLFLSVGVSVCLSISKGAWGCTMQKSWYISENEHVWLLFLSWTQFQTWFFKISRALLSKINFFMLCLFFFLGGGMLSWLNKLVSLTKIQMKNFGVFLWVRTKSQLNWSNDTMAFQSLGLLSYD